MFSLCPGGEEPGEHDVQVSRRVGLLHRQDLLAAARPLPFRRQHSQAQVRAGRAGLFPHQQGHREDPAVQAEAGRLGRERTLGLQHDLAQTRRASLHGRVAELLSEEPLLAGDTGQGVHQGRFLRVHLLREGLQRAAPEGEEGVSLRGHLVLHGQVQGVLGVGGHLHVQVSASPGWGTCRCRGAQRRSGSSRDAGLSMRTTW